MRALPVVYSDFSFTPTKDGTAALVIDLDLGRRSVTNDAENVVAFVLSQTPQVRIFYRDSLGNWDELRHNGTHFTGFAPVSATDRVLYALPVDLSR